MPYWTRDHAAVVITERFFQVSQRQLMRWEEIKPVYLNGRAHALSTDWLAAAESRLRSMLAHQGAEHQPRLRLAKLGNRAMADKRERAAAAVTLRTPRNNTKRQRS
jgi:hypothetical protein